MKPRCGAVWVRCVTEAGDRRYERPTAKQSAAAWDSRPALSALFQDKPLQARGGEGGQAFISLLDGQGRGGRKTLARLSAQKRQALGNQLGRRKKRPLHEHPAPDRRFLSAEHPKARQRKERGRVSFRPPGKPEPPRRETQERDQEGRA